MLILRWICGRDGHRGLNRIASAWKPRSQQITAYQVLRDKVWVACHWTNNSAESVNHLLKQKADWRQLPVSSCIDNVYDIVSYRPCHDTWYWVRFGLLLQQNGKHNFSSVSCATQVLVRWRPLSHQSSHTKRRRDDRADDETAGEVIRPTCSCPVLIVKDNGRNDRLTFRHCWLSTFLARILHFAQTVIAPVLLLPNIQKHLPWCICLCTARVQLTG